MLTRAEMNMIRQLHRKRVREENGLFLAEGPKTVAELLRLQPDGKFRIRLRAGDEAWMEQHLQGAGNLPDRIEPVPQAEMERISLLEHPQKVMALVGLPADTEWRGVGAGQLFMVMDEIQDPGNTGTMIRLADWFGLDGVIATSGTADFYSPKVVQASMGSLFRVPLYSMETGTLISQLSSDIEVTGTSLKGENLYHCELPKSGLIVLGNESRGIHEDWNPVVSKWIRIPSHGNDAQKAESLNVAIAAAIVCSEFRRRASG